MTQTEHDTKHDTGVNTCLRAQIFAICAFFVALTALAIYVMVAYPQTGGL